MEPYNDTVPVNNNNVDWQPQYTTPANYDWNQVKNMEVNHEPSKTIPNQAMTIKEILDRYRRGLPVTAGKVPIWEGDEGENPITPPEWDKMDLNERNDYMRQQARKLAEFRIQKRKEADEAAIKEQRDRMFAEFEEIKRKEAENSTPKE